MELHGEGSGSRKAAGDETGAKVEWADMSPQSKNLVKIQSFHGNK